jgi:hypothetical protein
MLPFLAKAKPQVGVIIKQREPDSEGSMEESKEEMSDLEYCAKDLIEAIHAKDHKMAAIALQSAFEMMESMPQEELNEMEDSESYE